MFWWIQQIGLVLDLAHQVYKKPVILYNYPKVAGLELFKLWAGAWLFQE